VEERVGHRGSDRRQLDSRKHEGMSYTTFHWRTFNLLLRIMGILWVLGGVGFILWSIYFLFEPAPPNANYLVGPAVDYAVVGTFVIVVGVLCLKLEPYRPDLGAVEGPYRWWTGDKIQG